MEGIIRVEENILRAVKNAAIVVTQNNTQSNFLKHQKTRKNQKRDSDNQKEYRSKRRDQLKVKKMIITAIPRRNSNMMKNNLTTL